MYLAPKESILRKKMIKSFWIQKKVGWYSNCLFAGILGWTINEFRGFEASLGEQLLWSKYFDNSNFHNLCPLFVQSALGLHEIFMLEFMFSFCLSNFDCKV